MVASCDDTAPDGAGPVVADPERVLALHELLRPTGAPPAPGDPVPALWHWVALARWHDADVTGEDGHPERDGRLEEALRHLPTVRRMFAGGEVVLGPRPLLVGDRVMVSTRLESVAEKSGASGPFVLASFETRVRAQGVDVLTERQDIVYTAPRPSDVRAPAGPLPVVGRPLRPRDDGDLDLLTDPTTLLRFSALTANTHRIHFDLDHARTTEGLPGLLVHGPLLNLALAAVATSGIDPARVRRVVHRNTGPVFVGERATLRRETTGPGQTGATAEVAGRGPTGRVRIDLDPDTEEPA